LPEQGSAQKRQRQSEKRREKNRAVRSRIKTEVRSFFESAKEKDVESAKEQLREIVKLIDTAAGKGVFHKRTAARKKSRLQKHLNSITAAEGNEAD
jgi:small subunit ribosomal protein S20